MRRDVLDSLTQLLRQQRGRFLQEFHRAEEGLEVMAEERETELEEHAQEEQSALFLTHYKEIIDRLDVEELVWQTERRTRESAPEVTQRWEDLPGGEDIVETLEEGKEFVAPAKPIADE